MRGLSQVRGEMAYHQMGSTIPWIWVQDYTQKSETLSLRFVTDDERDSESHPHAATPSPSSGLLSPNKPSFPWVTVASVLYHALRNVA